MNMIFSDIISQKRYLVTIRTIRDDTFSLFQAFTVATFITLAFPGAYLLLITYDGSLVRFYNRVWLGAVPQWVLGMN